MSERFKSMPTRASTVHVDMLDMAVRESKSGESFRYFARTSREPAIIDSCPQNGAHHYIIDSHAGLVLTGTCKHCGKVKVYKLTGDPDTEVGFNNSVPSPKETTTITAQPPKQHKRTSAERMLRDQEVRRLWDTGETTKEELAEKFDIRPKTVHQIIKHTGRYGGKE